jgi:dihydropteroate synthase
MLIGKKNFNWGERTYVMGVVNVTPDSFSGDGTMTGPAGIQRAVEQALRFEDDGADIIDVGGESTRPPAVYAGAKPVSAAEELQRVIPVIEALVSRLAVPVSIDSRKAAVASAAVRSGAAMLNDISMLEDPGMAAVAASTGAPIVISHIRPKAIYDDPVADVASDLSAAVRRAEDGGVSMDQIIADPGIGFGKRSVHSLAVLRGLRDLKERLGLPLLVGTSRKSFIGAVLDLPVEDRVEGTAATVALAIASGADIVRVHDVRQMVRVARMADAVVRGWTPVEPT